MSKFFIGGLISLCLLGCATTQSQAGKGDSSAGGEATLSPEQAAAIEEISKIGRRIYEKDYFAAVASDLLLEKINPSDYPGFRGWVTFEEGENIVVHFYVENDGQVGVLADITFHPDKKVDIIIEPKRAPSELEVRTLKARVKGLEEGWNDCSDRFNTVVLPGPNGSHHVYVLAATTDPNAIVVGGHSRVTVSPDGTSVEGKEPFSRSCLVLDKSNKNLPEGSKVTAMFVTDVVSPYPAPTHVFLSLLHKQSLYVGTEMGIWVVSQGHIQFMGKP